MLLFFKVSSIQNFQISTGHFIEIAWRQYFNKPQMSSAYCTHENTFCDIRN